MIRALTFFLCAALFSACPKSAGRPDASSGDAPSRVLFVTESRGFRHDSLVIAREVLPTLLPNPQVDHTESLADAIHGGLGRYKAIVFYTSGELQLSDDDKAKLLEFVRGGGGFVGVHSATDTLYQWPEYAQLVGARFQNHPWTQKVRVKVEKPSHPIVAGLPASFEVTDELYQFKEFVTEGTTVLLSLDPASVDMSAPGAEQKPWGHPIAWTREVGSGRSFYLSLGHPNEQWQSGAFTTVLQAGLLWAMKEDPPRPLFDGSTTNGIGQHQLAPDQLVVQDGTLTCKTGGNGYWFIDEELQDYELSLEYRFTRPNDLAPGADATWPGNSGYLIHSQKPHGVWPKCIEVQGAHAEVGKIFTIGGAAAITATDYTAARSRVVRPVGEWNHLRITSRGGALTSRLNGTVVATSEAGELKKGFVGFQCEGSEISWRVLRLLKLNAR